MCEANLGDRGNALQTARGSDVNALYALHCIAQQRVHTLCCQENAVCPVIVMPPSQVPGNTLQRQWDQQRTCRCASIQKRARASLPPIERAISPAQAGAIVHQQIKRMSCLGQHKPSERFSLASFRQEPIACPISSRHRSHTIPSSNNGYSWCFCSTMRARAVNAD